MRPQDGPAHCEGDRIALHAFSCTSPAQHQRAIIGGTILRVLESTSPRYPDVVAFYYKAVLDTGERVELGPGNWAEDTCPNYQPNRAAILEYQKAARWAS
jgi:hypothetical protein